MRTSSFIVVAVCCLGLGALRAQAQTLIQNNVTASDGISGTAGPAGLVGDVGHNGRDMTLLGSNNESLAAAMTELGKMRTLALNGGDTTTNGGAGGSPNHSSYTATSLVYTGSDKTPTNMYIGADSNGTAASDTNAVETSVFRAAGFVNVMTPGTYKFSVTNSDDASYILVDNQLVAGVPGSHGTEAATGTVNFTKAGYYPIEVLYANQAFDNNGMPDQGGGSFTYTSDIPNSAFVQSVTPEPATLGALGIAAFGVLARRRKA